MTRTVESGSRESICTPQRCRRLPRPFLSQTHQQVQMLQTKNQSPQSQAALAEKRKSESDDETGETKRTAVEMSAKDVEMNNTECNDEVTADPVRYQASEGKRRRVAARIEEAVEHAMDCGDVDLIAAVQEAIESEKDEQEEPDEIWGGKEWLDPRLVRGGRLEELKRLKHFDVYEAVDESEATGQIVD